jgi:hypothetical protein
MPKRSSIKKAKRDFSQVAFDLVAKLTEEKSKPEERQETLSAALDDDALRKQVMREMGSRGGKKGGVARAVALSPEKRAEIAQKAATARWDKS